MEKDPFDEILRAFSSRKKAKGYAKKEAPKAKKFLILFLVSFLALNALIFVIPLELFEYPIAAGTLGYLQVKGMTGTITMQEPVLISMDSGMKIIISYLCTGLLEMFVLWASIISSIGISLRKRLIGIALGFFGTMAFNFTRIFITLEFILNADTATVEFVHNILFRITLLLVIVGLYAFWFRWAVKQK